MMESFRSVDVRLLMRRAVGSDSEDFQCSNRRLFCFLHTAFLPRAFAALGIFLPLRLAISYTVPYPSY